MNLLKYKSCNFICFFILLVPNESKTVISSRDIYLHTKEYIDNWENNGNKNYLFYDEETFGIDLFSNSCEIMTKAKFRKYLNRDVNCIGEWCSIDDKYNCEIYNNKNCYNVEHIIDNKGPEFVDCNKNIVGNYVMAWGRWNQNLGLIANRDYNSSTHEKGIVYGEELMEKVRNKFKECGC